jgi:hypothetical protein
MVDETKIGSDWTEDELDVIVKDYFDMLADDLGRQPYSKVKHNAALEARIGRSHGSIEFKHQNISAVLEKLGLPWITGYKPRRNYQGIILNAIDRYLSKNQRVLEIAPAADKAFVENASAVFVNAPELTRAEPAPERLRRLLKKFDPVERDHLNRNLGKAGEAFVLDIERKRLSELDRPDLARKVRWIAAEDGDGAGYDVLSFNLGGESRLIEVKTTNGSARTPFFLTRNECDLAAERPADWRVYRVHLFARVPRIFTIAPPLENAVKLTTETWRASF